jgi:hypothetical protein
MRCCVQLARARSFAPDHQILTQDTDLSVVIPPAKITFFALPV